VTPALTAFACVLGLVTTQEVPNRCWTPKYEEIAGAILAATERHPRVNPERVAADIFHESSYQIHVIGTHGEIGLMQVKRGGAVPPEMARLPNRILAQPYLNIELGVSYMDWAGQPCRTTAQMLTRYNRPANGCRSGKYARGVERDLRRGHAALRRMMLAKRDQGRRAVGAARASRANWSAGCALKR